MRWAAMVGIFIVNVIIAFGIIQPLIWMSMGITEVLLWMLTPSLAGTRWLINLRNDLITAVPDEELQGGPR